VVAVNDLGSAEANAHLFKYDSVHGRYPHPVTVNGDTMDVGRGPIKVTAVKNPDWQAPNINLDTGKPTALGEYPLADRTYRELLARLANDHFEHTDEALRQDILRFYERFGIHQQESRIDRCDAVCWRKTWIEVNQLRSVALLDAADRTPPRRPTKASTDVKNSAIAASAGLNRPKQ